MKKSILTFILLAALIISGCSGKGNGNGTGTGVTGSVPAPTDVQPSAVVTDEPGITTGVDDGTGTSTVMRSAKEIPPAADP